MASGWTEWVRVRYSWVSGPRPSQTPFGFSSFHGERTGAGRKAGVCTVNPSYSDDEFSFVAIAKPDRVSKLRSVLPDTIEGGSSIITAEPVSRDERRRLWKMGVPKAKAAGLYVDRTEPTKLKLAGVEVFKSDPEGNRHVASQCPNLVEREEGRKVDNPDLPPSMQSGEPDSRLSESASDQAKNVVTDRGGQTLPEGATTDAIRQNGVPDSQDRPKGDTLPAEDTGGVDFTKVALAVGAFFLASRLF